MDSTTLKCWRGGLALLLAVDAGVLGYTAWSLQRFKPIPTANPVLAGLAANPVLLALVYALTLVALVGYLGPHGRLLWGFVALGGMKVFFETFASVYAAHHQDFLQSGAVLMGFILGDLYAYCIGLRAQRSEREWLTAKAFGATGAVAVFAATYVNAGSSKLLYGGLDWSASSTLQLH